jgi:glyceraldehyde 3-phosphate dehydrogenase
VVAVFVPVADGSLTDITFNVNRAVTIDEINEAFRYAAQHLKRHDYTEDPMVS